MPIELLKAKIAELENSSLPNSTREYLSSDNPDVAEIKSLCVKLLITEDGKTDYDNIRHLGKKVGPGEQDSFGWLTGILYTTKGRIVFG